MRLIYKKKPVGIGIKNFASHLDGALSWRMSTTNHSLDQLFERFRDSDGKLDPYLFHLSDRASA